MRAWEAAMALNEAVFFWRTKGSGPLIDRNGGPLELSALGGTKKSCARRKVVGLNMVLSTRRRIATSPGTSISLEQRLHKLSLKSSTNRSLTVMGHRNVCRAKISDEDDPDDDKVYDGNGFDKNGRNRFGRDQFGVDDGGLDEMGIPEDAVFNSPIAQPEYVSYIDPNTGEPSPTYGFRNPLPNAAFWGEDLSRIQKSSPSSAAVERFPRSSIGDDKAKSGESEASDIDRPSPRKRTRAGGKRKKKKENWVEPDEHPSEDLSEEEVANIAQLESLKDKFRAEEEAGTYKSIAQVIKESNEDEKAEEVDGGVSEVGEGEEEGNEDVSLGNLFGESGFGDRGYALVGGGKANENDMGKPLTNEELWWNWQKPPPGKKPWSAWQKRAGDSDTVMAAAMAETGQIKLFGEKPTIAEATLARARKRVFYNERMEAEEARKKEIGPLAYYKEWVKAYKGDTSKEAVQRHFEETGEDEGLQLLDMFAYQTAEEYRIMMGTDVRIRRDPLTMRMREDQIKQVWGGDPVYPTVNYEQDPDSIADYRNENMHEPIPSILDILRESGRLLTQEEVKAMLEQEKIDEDELDMFEGVGGDVGIGDDDDEEELEEDDEEIDYEDHTAVQSILAKPNVLSKESPPNEQISFELDEVIDGDGVIDVALDAGEVEEVTEAD